MLSALRLPRTHTRLPARLRYWDAGRTMHIAWLANAALVEKTAAAHTSFCPVFLMPRIWLRPNVQKVARFGGSDSTPPSTKLWLNLNPSESQVPILVMGLAKLQNLQDSKELLVNWVPLTAGQFGVHANSSRRMAYHLFLSNLYLA